MDVQFGDMWGDESRSQIFVQAYCKDLCLIFRLAFNHRDPESLPSRVVTFFHELPTKVDNETFADRGSMRQVLYAAIRTIWPQCILHPAITTVDITVEIYSDIERHEQWCIRHESVYQLFIESLLPVSSPFANTEAQPKVYNTVDYSSLIRIKGLAGRGSSTLVQRSASSDTLYVFKGVDFGLYLQSEPEFQYWKDVCYDEIRTVCSLPQHPNIVRPPSVFVTTRRVEDGGKTFVCGTLYPFMKHGSLDEQVEKSKSFGLRLPLVKKAKWCLQMASAIAHTHFTAHTYHMDIKPPNFLVDDNEDLMLIDWEQAGATLYILAPEANGTWDAEELTTTSTTDLATPKLVYPRYDGPIGEIPFWVNPKRNVFSIWRDVCPRALEAAEVFSLGRSMWMVLQEVADGEICDMDEYTFDWNEDASDIPDDWKVVVSSCFEHDPNNRIRLSELVKFWTEARLMLP